MKKKIAYLLITAVLLLSVGCNKEDKKPEENKEPQILEEANVPVVDAGVVEVESDENNIVSQRLIQITVDDYNNYVEKLKMSGYTNNVVETKYLKDTGIASYSATNEKNFSVTLIYQEADTSLLVSIIKPE